MALLALFYVARVAAGAGASDNGWYPPSKKGMICAGGKGGPCHGDSGGPLVIQGTNELVGITSHGKYPCGDVPSAFTNVASFIPWIEENCGHCDLDY